MQNIKTQDMDAYFEQIYAEHRPQYALPQSGKEEYAAWKDEWSRVLRQDLGGFPAVYGPLQTRVEQEMQREGYLQQLVVFSGERGMEIPAYLLIPDSVRQTGQKSPAVIAVAGHGCGISEICALTPDHQAREIGQGYQKDFAAALCRREFVVLAPEMLGFGMRRFREDCEKSPGQSSCFRMSTNLLMMGMSMAGVRARDVMRSVDYLETLEFVDAQRIGAIGISGGGTTLMYAGALEERLKAVVLSGSGCTYRDSILKIFHCTDNFVPGVYQHGEMCDVLGLMAPRALLLEAGDQDDIFPLPGVMECYDRLHQFYSRLGAEDSVELDVFHGIHEIHGGRSYEFLEQWLTR